jgi:hypothetical protein
MQFLSQNEKKNSWTIDMMLSTPSTRTPCIQWCVGLQHLIAKSFFLWWHTNSQRFKIKLGSKGQTTKSVIADWDWKECLVYKIMQPPLLWLKDLYFHCLPSFRKARVALMATYEARVSQVNSSPFCSPSYFDLGCDGKQCFIMNSSASKIKFKRRRPHL